MHLYKQYLFKPQTVAFYSEQDFIVKFWSYAFEEVFSNSGLCLLLTTDSLRGNKINSNDISRLIKNK